MLRASFASVYRHRAFFAVLSASTCAVIANYELHVLQAPVTGRKRYIGFSKEQMHAISTAMLDQVGAIGRYLGVTLAQL